MKALDLRYLGDALGVAIGIKNVSEGGTILDPQIDDCNGIHLADSEQITI